MTAVQRYLRDKAVQTTHQAERRAFADLMYDIYEIGDQWQTRDGNFTKRLSRKAYQAYGIKLAPDDLSKIGVIARNHSKAVDMTIEVTRQLNKSSRYFANDGSCWWGSYGESRCAFKTNGGFALRSFDRSGFRDGPTGRAWVLPLRKQQRTDAGTYTSSQPRDCRGRFAHAPHKRLTPTFDTLTPDAMVVFNGYGELSGYTPARIVSHMLGWTYQKINFDATPMYINSGGYLVGPEPVVQATDELYLSVHKHSRLFETETEEGHVNVA
jgi:hypothetical protein